MKNLSLATLLAAIGVIALATPPAHAAVITYIGAQFDMEVESNDPTAGWRNATTLKPLDPDGDNSFGTDGWRIGTNLSSAPAYASTTSLAPNNNGGFSQIDNPSNPSGNDINTTVFHDANAGTGDESAPLLGFGITAGIPPGDIVRVGILFDSVGSATGQNTATYTLKQTVGGTASVTTPAFAWQDGGLDIALFDLQFLSAGDQFVVTSTTISTPEWPGAFEQVVGITFDTATAPRVTPEPATASLLLLSTIAMQAMRRRRMSSKG